MAYTDEINLLIDQTNDLHKKVAKAIDVAARDVVNESPVTPDHEIRIEWAYSIRSQGPDILIPTAHFWLPRILDNATIAAAGNVATDNDVQFVVNGLVTTMAKGISGT